MPVWVSLLRGVNLASRNRVSMPLLREALGRAGFADVRTYVQSGNVVARSSHRSAERVGADVRAVLRENLGVDVPVVVRTPAQLADVLAWNPFPDDAAARPKFVQVVHLDGDPAPDAVRALLAQDVAPDGLAVRGRELVVRYADTMRNSRIDHPRALARLGVDGTARNWRTLHALVDLTPTTR